MIMIIESDRILAECIARACGRDTDVRIYPDAVAAMDALDDELPDLIFLGLLLTGPDGFTFLNELISYPETAIIPVVLVSPVDLSAADLRIYGIVGTLHTDTMTPVMIKKFVQKYGQKGQNV